MVGIGGALVGFSAHGMDIRLFHQSVNPLAGAVELRLQQLMQAVQAQCRILLM